MSSSTTLNPTITPDPAYDILRAEHQPLRSLLSPQTIAVIGASNQVGSVGHTLLRNLIHGSFHGTVFPVNPKHASVMGIQAHPSIAAIPQAIDLAIIATPAATVPKIVQECVDAGVKSAVIISAGFKEVGAAGVELEQQILAIARQGNLRIVGPNCLGVMNPHSNLNATFASIMARPGNVGFISQSGALCTAVLDWSLQENVGFSVFASIGSMLDVGWGDLIDYLGDDPHTQSIVIYMESIGDARSFLSAAREVALSKPIIVIKAGRTEAAAQAAASHTGALTGSDEVFNAALRRSGVLRVDHISELFDMAEVFAKQPRPQGPRLTMITNAGGAGVLATDALVSSGGQLANLADSTIANLNEFLPPFWSHSNPIDILGDATPERYAQSLQVAMQDPNSDGLLIILTPQSMTDPTATAQEVNTLVSAVSATMHPKKPILATWMGGADVKEGESLLNQAKIPTYPYPDAAARVFNYMWRYSYNLRGIYETPMLPPSDAEPNRVQVEQWLQTARQEQRTLLTEAESKQVLAAYGIPVVPTLIASSEAEAVAQAESIGYPIVLKLFSKTITHKTDVGGVQLNLRHADAVRWAYQEILTQVTAKAGAEHFLGVTVQPMISPSDRYELILGSSIDPQFGPVLLFGSGGQLVEVFKDRAIALPPLNTTLARRMMEQTKIYTALQGVRGRAAVDLAALEQLLVRFSQLVIEQPWIQEIDINPLVVAPKSDTQPHDLLVLDARVVLHPPQTLPEQLPKPAICPYPTQYVSRWTMKNGQEVTIRPIRPEDEPMAVKFHQTLSERSVYFRYFHLVKLSQRTAHERMTRLCFIDYDREMALVVEHENPETGEPEMLAVGRLSKLHGNNEAEFALLVSDPAQGLGLGTELLDRLIQIGKADRLSRITADILGENTAMQRVCEKVGFRLQRSIDLVKAEIDL
ncbi:MAG: bifunctional acetate--CoA ligase family protein/GNAT family N-acetyltransferase [Oculatellaceae cyanobacterium Prado106]|jgi:acetyltransferase|nr:bifunctional acetate--CoA ligase family protein/GNAT family N-acetyltransferase [Oculatellaceae cyanobacterium Prado106]